MVQFRSEALDDLTRQFSFTPPERRKLIIENAESLYWEMGDELVYPLEFLIYRLTSYRPDTVADVSFIGAALKHDLLSLVESLSSSLNEKFDDYEPRPFSLDDLAAHLGVSKKTISRYRKAGLFARKLRGSNNRKQLAFLPSSVNQFQEHAGEKLNSAKSFSRIPESIQHQIITRARRILHKAPETKAMHIATHLSKKYNRSAETIRSFMLRHDQNDPRVALFQNRNSPLTRADQLDIYHAYRQGESVSHLAKKYNHSRSVIYRSINLARIEALNSLQLKYIDNPTFAHPEAAEVILNTTSSTLNFDDQASSETADTAFTMSDLYERPAPDQAAEQSMFLLYNYLKYLAHQVKTSLDPYHPASGKIDESETYLRRAVKVKHHIVSHYLRLVISVARQHVTSQSANHQLSELIADGNLILLQAVETFDVSRGNRFSTYISWALMRQFAHAHYQPGQYDISYEQLSDNNSPQLPFEMNPPHAGIDSTQELNRKIIKLLDHLNDRERLIITRHFGLPDSTQGYETPMTLSEISKTLNISPERARQIEKKGLSKLLKAAQELDIVIDDLMDFTQLNPNQE